MRMRLVVSRVERAPNRSSIIAALRKSGTPHLESGIYNSLLLLNAGKGHFDFS